MTSVYQHHTHHQQLESHLAVTRSTKGASKTRRDQINVEIRKLRDLLPLSDADKSRLSYLHIMALACLYMRKASVFEQVTQPDREETRFLHTTKITAELPGFLLIIRGNGKLVYISENVLEILGYSMVDVVIQGDNLYDITDKADHPAVRKALYDLPGEHGDERSFTCHMTTSRALRQHGSNRAILVHGSYQHLPFDGSSWSGGQVFWAFCTPVQEGPAPFVGSLSSIFESRHGRDMRYVWTSESMLYYLGYSGVELIGTSWYKLLHPEDLGVALEQNIALGMRNDAKVITVLRLQTNRGEFLWVRIIAVRQENYIDCTNHVISVSEAAYLLKPYMVAVQTPLGISSRMNQSVNTIQESTHYLSRCTDSLSSPISSASLSTIPRSAESLPNFDFTFSSSSQRTSNGVRWSQLPTPAEKLNGCLEERQHSEPLFLSAFDWPTEKEGDKVPSIEPKLRFHVCTPPYTLEKEFAVHFLERVENPMRNGSNMPLTPSRSQDSSLGSSLSNYAGVSDVLPLTPDSPACFPSFAPDMPVYFPCESQMIPHSVTYSDAEHQGINELAQQISCFAESFDTCHHKDDRWS